MPVQPNPTIKITFDGLLVYAFVENVAQPLRCQIGVVKAAGHVLRINRKSLDAEKTITYTEIADEIQSGDLSIEIPERTGREGVDRFHGAAGDNDHDDFDWLVDVEGGVFHNRPLQLKAGFPIQSIFVLQGLFHTAGQIPVTLIRPGGDKRQIVIASPVGLNFYMSAGEKFIFNYGTAGKKIEIIAEPGVRHEIAILNTPGTIPHGAGHPPGHDPVVHFPFFYDLAIESPITERFDIQASSFFSGADSQPPHLTTIFAGTPDRPCPDILLGKKSNGLG